MKVLTDTFRTDILHAFVEAVLDDDTGISETAFDLLGRIATMEFLERIDSTDGRFYLNPDS